MTAGLDTTLQLDALFAPASVAIVGASPDRHYSRSMIANLRQHGYDDVAIFPINPRYESVDGLRCYPSLDALVTAPDAVAVLVGRSAATAVIGQATAVGARAALVIADGYAEESADGRAQQHELGRAARDAGLAMLGPNTLGYVVPSTGAGLWCAGTLPHPLRPGGVALLAQSSGMLNLLMSVAGQRALGIRACVSVGNAEVIGLPDLVRHFVADDECTTLGLVVESIDRPRELMEALALARAAGKPVVVLKIGVSTLGRANSVAHTGRLAGPEQGWTTLFDRLGVCAARDMDDFLETLTLFGGLGPHVRDRVGPAELGVAFATISGGETSLVCDVAEQEGLAFACLDQATLTSVRDQLGKASTIGNPLDLQNTRTSRPDVFWGCLDALCADPNVDVLAVRLNLSARPTEPLTALYRDVVAKARDAGVQPVVLTRAYEYLDLAWWQLFSELGVPFVLSYRNAMRAFAAFNRWLTRRADEFEPPAAVPATVSSATGPTTALEPDALRRWLRSAGVDYVSSATVAEPADAAAAAETIGYPVVLKAVAPGLVHKSEAGGVALDLADADAVDLAASTMRERVAQATGLLPEQIGFEVQRMVADGIEVIVGMNPDPTWGPVVMVGSGGIYAETVGDVVWELPPISPARARTMLQRLRIWPILDGSRGREPVDVDALVELVTTFADALIASPPDHLVAVDLNPVVVGAKGRGAIAVDAAVLVRTPSPDSDAGRPEGEI